MLWHDLERVFIVHYLFCSMFSMIGWVRCGRASLRLINFNLTFYKLLMAPIWFFAIPQVFSLLDCMVLDFVFCTIYFVDNSRLHCFTLLHLFCVDFGLHHGARFCHTNDRQNMALAFTQSWQIIVGKQDVRILMMGLDAAGKTTIVYKFKLGEVQQFQPLDSMSKLSSTNISVSLFGMLVAEIRFDRSGATSTKVPMDWYL